MKTRILVTSALPYVNNVPHLGNLVCVISADVFTRYLRLKGVNVIYVLGTDEHGTTTETRAIKEGLTPKEICDKYAKLHKEIYDWFLCSPDCWGRSSSKVNAELTQKIFLKLHKNGYIFEQEVEQAYCEHCQRFLSDRYIRGECPYCGYQNARGDQCEKCSKLLEPKQLITPVCDICGNPPIFKKSKHLFIDLPKLEPKLRVWIKENEQVWSVNARTMTQGWLKEGLQPRCITRDLKWGIPVPIEGYEGKVFYSWFDAPIAYIGITKENRDDWELWWKNPKGTELVQFMGKDNIPFHTILFPASLIGTHENWTLLNRISVNEYLNYEGGMFSKSQHKGVFGDDAITTGIAPDVYRYYLMVNRPEKSDTEFSWRDFQQKNNHELVDNLGNLIYRVVSFMNRFYNAILPNLVTPLSEQEQSFREQWLNAIERVTRLMEGIELKKGLREIMELSKLGNKFFQDAQPWHTIKSQPRIANNTLVLLTNLVKDLAILVEPFMPRVSQLTLKQLNFTKLNWDELGKLSLGENHKLGPPSAIFNKLDEATVAELEAKFSGKKASKHNPLSVEKLELRVAEVIKAEQHPNADKLLVLKLSLGGEERQIVAGIKGHYKLEELRGKHIIIVTNLEPAMLRGIMSNGMLLAAVNKNYLKILEAPNSKPGEKVYIKGLRYGLRDRISIKEFKRANLKVYNSNVYSGELGPLRTKSEIIKVEMPDGTFVE